MPNRNDKKGLLKRLSIVLGCIVACIVALQLITFEIQPYIQYTLKEADCGAPAIAARNKLLGAELKSCVLTISAKNLQDKSVYVDYDGVGGGPIGDSVPLIRIYSGRDKFCYALLTGGGASFSPGATNTLTLRCGGVQKPPKDYDENSDTKPTSIVIAGHSKATIDVDPTY